ncbi:MAG: DNA mismatch repair endonuclease MutL [Bacteroidales bacterium]|nr:DNA mismatch repair endonuclease MutL [Bacteroidales bacterium]
MDIRILPSNIANMIAAGEVVQRPASVVKELVENSVDAGADQVTVVIQDAGRTLIQVIDNGCGMSPDQAVLCFERHATSKLHDAEDLQNILTFGFRGEALASIAAVAEVTLKTRREEDEVGCQVDFADSQHLATQEVAAPRGANFCVRNLFYNVPARRKFLKSDNVEFKHIVSEFIRVALTRPEVGFTLTHNGKDVYVLRPAKSLKFRIQDVLGANVANEIVDVHAQTSVVEIGGFVGRPDMARKGLGNQYFFVNGRYFRSPYLHKAVMKAYENLIPDGVTPTYLIYLDINPQSVDVNIHPTKTEIKFEDDSVIFQILFACIRESLGRNSFADSIDFDREGVPDIPAFGKNFDEIRPVFEPQPGLDSSYNPFDNDGFPSESSPFSNSFSSGGYPSVQPEDVNPYSPGTSPAAMFGDDWDREEKGFNASGYGYGRFVENRDDYGKLFEDKIMPGKSVLVLQDKYIITTGRSGLMAINVTRAMERILYDRFLDALSRNAHVTQTALFPVTVQVGVENMCLFEEHSQMLADLGFDIAPFGTDTIVVNGVPEGYSAEAGKVQMMIGDLLLILADDHSALPEMMTANMASRLARLGALSGDPVTNQVEAQRLIDKLFASENPEFTSTGRRVMSLIPIDEIDKKF